MWDKINHFIGNVSPNSSTKFSYTYKGDKKIVKVKPGCSNCTVAKLKGRTLEVTYNAGGFSQHLKKTHTQLPINKNIFVEYEDGSKDKLTFSGYMINR